MVKMCEIFPVKCKPGINLDMVFFVCQPANVMNVTGQRAESLLCEEEEEEGGEVVWEKKKKKQSLLPGRPSC